MIYYIFIGAAFVLECIGICLFLKSAYELLKITHKLINIMKKSKYNMVVSVHHLSAETMSWMAHQRKTHRTDEIVQFLASMDTSYFLCENPNPTQFVSKKIVLPINTLLVLSEIADRQKISRFLVLELLILEHMRILI